MSKTHWIFDSEICASMPRNFSGGLYLGQPNHAPAPKASCTHKQSRKHRTVETNICKLFTYYVAAKWSRPQWRWPLWPIFFISTLIVQHLKTVSLKRDDAVASFVCGCFPLKLTSVEWQRPASFEAPAGKSPGFWRQATVRDACVWKLAISLPRWAAAEKEKRLWKMIALIFWQLNMQVCW